MTGSGSIPIPPRDSSPTARTGHPKSSIRRPSSGPIRSGGGATLAGQVVYEMHVGTFTREGTWAAAARELEELARLGITLDRVDAGRRLPREIRLGIRRRQSVCTHAVVRTPGRLPALRQHGARRRHRGHPGRRLQPSRSGRELPARLCAGVLHRQVHERVGRRDQFRRPGRGARPRVLHRQRGLLDRRISSRWPAARRDAADLRCVGRARPGSDRPPRARRRPGDRTILLVAENEPQDTRLVRPLEQGGYGLDALWNDDFHHSAMVALTGRAEAYYSDTRGEPQEFISAAKYGYLFQGQQYHWQRQAARHAGVGPVAVGVRHVPAEPRSSRQLRARVARPPADQPGALAGDDRAAAADAGHADAVSGAGVLGVRAVPVLRRSGSGARGLVAKEGARDFLSQFPSIGRLRAKKRRSTTRAIRATFVALRPRLHRAAAARRGRTRCIRIS